MAKTVEEKYAEQAVKQQLLTRNLVDVVWVIDPETLKYSYISYANENLRGYTPEEIAGQPVKSHFTPASYQLVVSELLAALEEYRTNPDVKRVLEVEMFHKDGHTVWMELTARFTREIDGNIKVVGVSKNITQRKAAEAEREVLIGRLQEALDEKDRLLKENKILMGLLPICADCKKIRDEQGQWWPIEQYIASRTEAHFTHTLCPICKEKALEQARNLNRR